VFLRVTSWLKTGGGFRFFGALEFFAYLWYIFTLKQKFSPNRNCPEKATFLWLPTMNFESCPIYTNGGRHPHPIHGQPDAVLLGRHLKSLFFCKLLQDIYYLS
jgi:hypothetical protein